MKRKIKVTAWLESGDQRAEISAVIESPMVCEGACPVLQRNHDRIVAATWRDIYINQGLEISEHKPENE